MKSRRIHLIGICGIAMGTLACMLRQRGHRVTGSDAGAYPPMSEILRNEGIPVIEGFREENIDGADLVVVGNAISRGNPEVERMLNDGTPYLSMAGALHEFFLSDREVIAVAGTHGKTTTTALLSHILRTAGYDPSFFVGGVLKNYDSNFGLGAGRHFVIEGDEYDSAFFEKVPKFIFYRPRHLVLTSLEFDHADIYRDLGEIELWFRRLVHMIPSAGHIVYSRQYRNLQVIAEGAFARCSSFGTEGADFSWGFREYREAADGEAAAIDIVAGGDPHCVASPLTGDYNFMNVTAAAAMASLLGVSWERIASGVASFRGVRRRMELIYDQGWVRVYEDFAHHPTAVRGVLEHLKARYPDRMLWAVYEPRSATSRRNVFGHLLPGAFSAADMVLLREPYRLEAIPPGERLEIGRVRDEIGTLNGDAGCVAVCENADAIVREIAGGINPSKRHVIVVMSNGGFEGIYEKLKEALRGMPN
ncbi:MAG: UDP-N-acetylmuramate:L-alanyl-gamma-D-glutamyl-meso-diaminopimelate ligase [Spirochaetes bacterium]|nr:UDP-N-acetylmuramate:L-alanyl-gamma-D-glutamyl-meso-diaminopimelate ligase [Spirochaetota bacterium]